MRCMTGEIDAFAGDLIMVGICVRVEGGRGANKSEYDIRTRR